MAARKKYDSSFLGKKFGKLCVEALNPDEPNFCWTRCECGRRVRSRWRSLVTGAKVSCAMAGCKQVNRAFGNRCWVGSGGGEKK